MSVAESARRAMSLSSMGSSHELPFAEIPPDLLEGRELDLRRWTLLFTDRTAENLSRIADETLQRRVEEFMKEEPSKSSSVPLLRKIQSQKKSFAPFREQSRTKESGDDWRREARREAEAGQLLLQLEERRQMTTKRALEDCGVRSIKCGGATRLSDAGVSFIARSCPLLSEFDCSGAISMTDVGLRTLTTCSLLTSLDLGGCSLLKGAGLAALGKECRLLKKVRLAGCSAAVCGWALAGLVAGCGANLRDLDVSNCALLTDADVLCVAKHCPGLVSLNLASTRQTGDEAAVAIADCCSSLEKLDLSRTELAHRSTDVALLAVAEGCGKTLRELNLEGCTMITDVGVSWLAHKAGASLETLSLRGCERLTNAGCRAIAEHCMLLRKLDLHGARRVTDVGLRVLGAALGPSVLTYLDCSAMHLLTDGQDRGFGFEGLLALGRDAKMLESLHLAGCFQVSGRALLALSSHGLTSLTELGLAGCPKLTPEGMAAICQANTQLKRISLASCGDCVQDNLIQAIAKNTPQMKQAVLRDCPRFGLSGARSIARYWRSLEKLDLSGCSGIDDDCLSLLSTDMGQLKHLFLSQCNKIGDVGLSWLAEGSSSKGLVTLALLKTRCTSNACRSLADSFALSDFRKDSGFFGFWPKHRWEHRTTMRDRADRDRAVLKLQSLHRSRATRIYLKKQQELGFLAWACTRLQAFHRKHSGLKMAIERKHWLLTRNAAALEIQTLFVRVVLAKEHLAFLMKCRDHKEAVEAATRIQSAWRGLVTRRFFQVMVQRRRTLQRRRFKASQEVQRVFRGRKGREKAGKRRKMLRFEEERRRAASTVIQAAARGRPPRLSKKRKLRQLRIEYEKRQTAARFLQRILANRRTKRIMSLASKVRKRRLDASVKIQSLMRMKKAQLEVEFSLEERRRKRELQAVKTILAAERNRLARRELEARREDSRTEKHRQEQGATHFARLIRGRLGRTKAAWARRSRFEDAIQLSKLRTKAATSMISLCRGRRDRVTVAARRELRKARWKEMFDEDSQRPFFYDQITGEIRWRRPQDLLELMKRPVCGNCAYYEARLECAACGEFFCDECHASVHFGGKRAAHPFRALYDAFGLRVDHGDQALFESLWPSEIIQDDARGVLLRISPHRDPVQTVGTWQRYRDPDTRTDYFYNPVSGEGTYDAPLLAFKEQELTIENGTIYTDNAIEEAKWPQEEEEDNRGSWDQQGYLAYNNSDPDYYDQQQLEYYDPYAAAAASDQQYYYYDQENNDDSSYYAGTAIANDQDNYGGDRQ